MKKVFTVLLVVLGVMMGCTDSKALIMEGTLYMKGSSPHTYLVLEQSKTHTVYKIINEEDFELIKKQKHQVTLKVEILKNVKEVAKPQTIKVLKFIK